MNVRDSGKRRLQNIGAYTVVQIHAKDACVGARIQLHVACTEHVCYRTPGKAVCPGDGRERMRGTTGIAILC